MVKKTTSIESPAQSLNGVDYKKIGKGAALAFGAAVLYSIAAWLSSGEINWNLFLTVCIPAALSTGINAVMKWYQGQPQ